MNTRFISSFFKKQADEEESPEMKFGLARVFKYQQLKKATNSFATELGHGGYGRVYLGKLENGQMVAVKVLFDRNPKRLEHFFNEVTVLSRVRHKNLISLYGCTNPTTQELLLVYEYAPNGTVADHLHGQQSTLNWAARIRIAVETAEALAYLHGLEPPIIHRDVKTSNILLDHAFNAKVADLGICRLLSWDTAHVSTMPQGTMGYRDPEYDRYFRLTDKTDVYSFGVVLMEFISGQQAVDVTRDPEDIYLDGMAIGKIINNELEELVDPKLGYHSNNDTRRMINSVAQLAAECLQPTGNTRPSMVQVVTVLKEFQNEMEQLGLNDGTAQFGSSTFGQSTGSGGGGGFLEGQILKVRNSRVFTFVDLESATGNFRPDNVLGKGGFGEVFKGWVDEKTLSPVKRGLGMVIAVKKLNPESLQGLKEWQSEVKFLGRLSHPNIVKLLGHCLEDKELLLVYEFMAKGSLDNHLFRRAGAAAFDPLSWDVRLKIIIGAVRALAFLHSSEAQVIYRGFKTSDILLDSNYNAKLSDFDLEKIGPTGGVSHITTRVIGTYGYAAPEYVATGRFYVKSDVYGFGVVLLEMLSGKRAGDRSRPSGEQNLVDWAKPYLADRRKFTRLMDPRLEGQYPSKGAFQAAMLTLKCLAQKPENRPSMKEVVETLEHIKALT